MPGSGSPVQGPSGPANIFSYAKDRMEELPPSRVLSVIRPGETLDKEQLLERVRERISSSVLEKDLLDTVFYLKHRYGLKFIPWHNGNYQVRHSERSASLYLEYLTSIFSPQVFLEKINFPGTGSKKDDRCGEVLGWQVCSRNPAHHKRPMVHTCNRKECPECYTVWITQATERAVSRLEGYMDAAKMYYLKKYARRVKIWPSRHFTFSPSHKQAQLIVDRAIEVVKNNGREDYMREDLPAAFLDELMREGYTALEKSGLRGAVVIPHLYQIKDEYEKFAVALRDQLNDGKPAWKPKFNRYTALTTLENYHQYLDFFPHIHVMAYGKAVEPDEFISRMPGWRYSNKYRDKNGRKKDYAPGTVIYYCLTHSPVIEGKQIVRYWGCIAPKRLRCVRKETAVDYVLCEECKALICPAKFSEEGGEGELLEIDLEHPVQRKYIVRTYVIAEGLPPPEHDQRSESYVQTH